MYIRNENNDMSGSQSFLTKSEKLELQKKYTTPGSIQTYIEEKTMKNERLNVVAILGSLPRFAKTLDPLSYDVFRLYYIDGKTIQEISTLLGNKSFIEISETLKTIDARFDKWSVSFMDEG